jgi:tyrosyl-tRNA synthetase
VKRTTLELLAAGTAQITPLADLEKKLAQQKPLIIKLGADPTAPHLHLGHAVVLMKMRQFQDLGHHIVFLIGDFTARIGDPTGKSKTRPALTEEIIAENTKSYFSQVSRILDSTKTTIVYNSAWLSKISVAEWLVTCGKVTVAQLIEREDFKNRLATQQPIGMHELMYPIMQGYDSVALRADVELGGTDQTFNLLMGRHLQQLYGQEGQVIITMPLLLGLDGVHKMSKSLGNAIGLDEPADQAYGKLMSISDNLMWTYYHLLCGMPKEACEQLQAEVALGTKHPLQLKKQMAHTIVSSFWGTTQADQAAHAFQALFQQKDLSAAQEFIVPETIGDTLSLIELIKLLGAAESNSQARALIQAGAVAIDAVKYTDIHAVCAVREQMVVKIGKHRFYRLKRQTTSERKTS